MRGMKAGPGARPATASTCAPIRASSCSWKCANTSPGEGEALPTINTAGVTTNSVSGSSFIDRALLDRPELAEFIEGEDDEQAPGELVTPITGGGKTNLGKLLLALARIEALEIKLKKGRRWDGFPFFPTVS